MKAKNVVKIPKDFFSINRPSITSNEALIDVIPVEWMNDEQNTKNQKCNKSCKSNKNLLSKKNKIELVSSKKH